MSADNPSNQETKEIQMQFYKRLLVLPAMLTAMVVGPAAQAENRMPNHDEECRSGTLNPLVGIWSGNLVFTTLGKATVLVAINPGGTFMETDSVDLTGQVGTASPGYAAWKALDCRHYTLTINKTLYQNGQFVKVVLPGTIVLSEDGNSWTVNLKQNVYDSAGNFLPTYSGSVTGSTHRIIAGSND
jgi:hypothetical protein